MTVPVQPDGGRTVHVVVGPKTRLGSALVRRLLDDAETVFVLARDDADHATLADGPAAVLRVYPGTEESLFADLRPSAVHVHVCALGPVHPGAPDTAGHAASVTRDLAALAQLLRCAAAPRIGVVLVSTVLTLAPGADRRYYAGWKGVLEQELRELVAGRPGATLSVLYPGRLIADDDVNRPWHRLHTRYRRLAALATRAAERPVDRIVGADARIWLLLSGLRVALCSVRIVQPDRTPVAVPPPERLRAVNQEVAP